MAAEGISWEIIIQTEWSIWYCIAFSWERLAKVDFVTGQKLLLHTRCGIFTKIELLEFLYSNQIISNFHWIRFTEWKTFVY